jgi:hypothetical protein
MELRMYRRARPDFPNEKTLQMFFGSKAKLLSNLRIWVADKPTYSDVAEMLGAEAKQPLSFIQFAPMILQASKRTGIAASRIVAQMASGSS